MGLFCWFGMEDHIGFIPDVIVVLLGTPDYKVFEAQYPARIFPCQRFDGDLTITAA
jgi:hypothetical protein